MGPNALLGLENRRHHMIDPTALRKRLPAYKRWEPGRPKEPWQMCPGRVAGAHGTPRDEQHFWTVARLAP
jgi:hypothetical protein